MNSPIEVKVRAGTKGFAEDKDEARRLRTDTIMPALVSDKTVIIDFRGVTSSTQSFVHALVGEALQKFGEGALQKLEFRSCAPQVKSLVELVVDYSLGGFRIGSAEPMEVVTGTKAKKSSETPPSPIKARRRGAPKTKRK
jgi:hypothetical protein